MFDIYVGELTFTLTRARLKQAIDAGFDIRHAGDEFRSLGRGRHFV